MDMRRIETHTPARTNSGVRAAKGLSSLGFVSVPAWFTVGAARKVAEAKKAPFVVVQEAAGGFGAVSAAELECAPAGHLVSRWVRRSPVEVSPQARQHEALALMDAAGTNWLPVRAATVLMGLVTRQSLTQMAPAELSATPAAA